MVLETFFRWIPVMKFATNQLMTLFVLVFMTALEEPPTPQPPLQSQIDSAINKLWSPKESERTEGLGELLRIGPASIERLTSVFADLINDQRPRFVSGREQEGERALEEYTLSVRMLYSRGGDYREARAAKERVTALALNSRLMTDVVHLLGELEAEQAIPLLMEMVNRNWEATYPSLGFDFHTPETAALERIGAASVLPLVDNLNESTIRAHGFEPLFHGWRIIVEDPEDDDEPDPDEELHRQTHVGYVRLRVAAVLGTIGDARALPCLEALLAKIKSSPESPEFGIQGSLSGTIESAIARIKKTGHWSEDRNANPRKITLVPMRDDSGGTTSIKKPE